jgi:hypothetical protein
VTDWRAIVQRAAYTRFCRTGSLEPFRLHREDLFALAMQVGAMSPQDFEVCRAEGVLRIQVRVPVPSLNARDVDAWVAVDEWAGKP